MKSSSIVFFIGRSVSYMALKVLHQNTYAFKNNFYFLFFQIYLFYLKEMWG